MNARRRKGAESVHRRMQFADLMLDPVLLAAVKAEGYESPTPIQREAIPHLLEGRDLVGIAQTGTGKTAAFALPVLHRLKRSASGTGRRGIRALVLSPTRELATQIDEGFAAYGKGSGLTSSVIFGGVGQAAQERALRRGMDILVATPGRLLDLMSQKLVDFRQLEVLVLDEADRMLDMGFIRDVRKIIAALPSQRQTLLFSATMPSDIEELARQILKDPVEVAVTPASTTVERIAQSIYFVEKANKQALLLHLLDDPAVRHVLVFTRTKHGADRVAKTLTRAGIGVAAIHGRKTQGQRERALLGFKSHQTRVLVATDIAARGIDVEDITHVIQFDLPEVPEQYVHRIGRTARAEASGAAWAFCDVDERKLLRDIEKTIRMKIDVVRGHPHESTLPDSAASGKPAQRSGQRGGQRGGGPRGGGQRSAGNGAGGGGGRARRTGAGGGGGRPRSESPGKGAPSRGRPSSSSGPSPAPAGGSSTPRAPGSSRSAGRSFGPGRR